MRLISELNLQDTTVNVTVKFGLDTVKTLHQEVDDQLRLEMIVRNLVPGATYTVVMEPRKGDKKGDPIAVQVTTKLADLQFLIPKNLIQSTTPNPNFDLKLEEYRVTWLKVLFSVAGRFDNITFSIEPNFQAVFKEFVENAPEILFTELIPGETYKITAIVKAGPWSVQEVKTAQMSPARPVCISFQEKDDSSVQLSLLNNGKGSLFTYQEYRVTWLKVLFSVAGRFDNITFSIEPNFQAVFKEFVENAPEILFTELIPGETYKITAIVKAGPWSVQEVKTAQMSPARPVCISFQEKDDSSVQLSLLNNGKGSLFTYQVLDGNVILHSKSEPFEKYKSLTVPPNFFAKTFKAFVSRNGVESQPFIVQLQEIELTAVTVHTLQQTAELQIDFSANYASFGDIKFTLDPDPDPGIRIAPAPDTRTGNIKVDQVNCGNDITLTITPYSGYSPLGPSVVKNLNFPPCVDFDRIEEKMTVLLDEELIKIEISIPFFGDVEVFRLDLRDPSNNLPDVTLSSKFLPLNSYCHYIIIYVMFDNIDHY